MPVNSFDDYALSWKPDRRSIEPPLYLGLARQLERDIMAGALPGGTKMPPQRELADYLDVSLNTITRAYTLCVKKGLLHAVTGKGTFVSEASGVNRSVLTARREKEPAVRLDIATPVCIQTASVLETMKAALDGPDCAAFFTYTHPLGTEKQRQAGARWLQQFGLPAEAERVLIANGTQNALALVLSALFSEGDKIAVDKYTYSNFIGLANMLNITLVPVSGDENGMSAAELEKLLHSGAVKGIYLSPSCSNPEAICMPAARRHALAALIRAYQPILIEDDCYAFLCSRTLPAISTLAPEQAVYLSGMNKAIAPGLRIAYLWCADAFLERLRAAVYNCNLMVNPIGAEFAAALIHGGHHTSNIQTQREQAARRSAVYARYFPLSNASSYYQWLPLPDGVSGLLFESLARKEGVYVYGSERFLAGDSDGKHYLRISTTAARTEAELEFALQKIQQMLRALRQEGSAPEYTL